MSLPRRGEPGRSKLSTIKPVEQQTAPYPLMG